MNNDQSNYGARAEFYDLEFHDTSDNCLLQSLVTENARRILEIPCGSGRNVSWLAQAGKEVVFADLSQEMIREVNRKLESFPNSRSASVCADMIHHCFGESFDLIIIPREGIQLIKKSELLPCLKNFRANLREDGFLYVDVAKLDPREIRVNSNLPSYIVKQSETYFSDIDTEVNGVHFKRWHCSKYAHGILTTDFRYEIRGREKNRRFVSTIQLTHYGYDEFLHYIADAGLIVVEVYGGYDMELYTTESDRMIFVLTHGI